MSFCTIKLSNCLILYLKDINPTTALICILKKESKTNEGRFIEIYAVDLHIYMLFMSFF